MNLRSGKILGKRPKKSSAKSDEEGEEDIISILPNALLIQILSLVPGADAIQMRILSKRWKERWKDLWEFLPNLHIVMPFCRSIEEINKFHNKVNQTLALRGGMPIQRFSLYGSKNFNYNRVRDWLHTVVQCKVQELKLRVPPYKNKVRFCWDLFNACNTLVNLTLEGKFMLDFPEAGLLLPCLKKMNLVSIVYTSDQSLAKLLSGCPSLEELSVEIDIAGWRRIFNVSSVSLKRLSILVRSCLSKNNMVVINAPKLKYLYIEDYMYTEFFLFNHLFNGEAHITVVTDAVTKLVARLSSAKKLTFTYPTMTALYCAQWIRIPIFPNLVKLVVGIQNVHHSNLLMRALLDMPNVEHITFSDLSIQRIKYKRWNLPLEAPACLRFKVKKIIVHNQEAVTPEDFIFIRYLLEQSTNLESLTINAHKIDPKMREQLLSIRCGSHTCRFEFVRNL